MKRHYPIPGILPPCATPRVFFKCDVTMRMSVGDGNETHEKEGKKGKISADYIFNALRPIHYFSEQIALLMLLAPTPLLLQIRLFPCFSTIV